MDKAYGQRSFNVLCVTKRTEDSGGRALFHQPITGTVEVEVSPGGIILTGHNASFNGEKVSIAWIRVGLSGGAVVIAINRNDGSFNIWELYTDEPALEGVTPDELRESAERSMRNPAVFTG